MSPVKLKCNSEKVSGLLEHKGLQTNPLPGNSAFRFSLPSHPLYYKKKAINWNKFIKGH